jgi:tetratricopeptide (TPR) repeat protein
VLVEILQNHSVKESFFVQIKGSESLNYIQEGKVISLQLSIPNIRYLLAKPIPTMIAVCDITKPERLVFWVWLDGAIEKIEKENNLWQSQESVTIHISTSDILSQNSKDLIEDYVKKFHTNLRINAEIGAVIAPSFGIDSSKIQGVYKENPETLISEQVLPHLKDVGLIDVFEEESTRKVENLTHTDQKLFQKLIDTSNCLNRFHDRDAVRILDEVSNQLQNASNTIKARYYNCKGVLSLHSGDFFGAMGFFEKACSLRTTEIRYNSNFLLTQYFLSNKSHSRYILPDDWSSRLEALISKNPEFAPTIRLKAYWVADTQSSEAAESFLRTSKIWNKELLENLASLAEIYERNNDIVKASALCQEAEEAGLSLDATFWSLRGFIHLRLALPRGTETREIILQGYGPSPLNISQLEKAKIYYTNAFEVFSEIGFPKISEETIVNYSAVLALLGEQEEIESICKTFLRNNPESYSVLANLVLALIHQGKTRDAIPYSRKVFQSNPEFASAYKNLALCLLQAEEFDGLLEHLKTRETTGFKEGEEGFSRVFATIALAELGDMTQAQRQVRLLKSNPALSIEGIIAEVELLRRSGGSREIIRSILRAGNETFPNDIKLLTLLAQTLGPPDRETADEIIQLLTKISEYQQLHPEQFSTLANAYLVTDHLEEANAVLKKAVERYPHEKQFLYEQSFVLMRLGDEDASFDCLRRYMKTGERTYQNLRNTAIMARNSGQLEEAIKLFELALRKASEKKDRGEIHCQLHLLKKHCSYPPKEILRHAIEYGETTGDDLAAEARFLMMCLLTPDVEVEDSEANKWIRDARIRLEKFSRENPRYHSLMTFKLPEGPTTKKWESLITDFISLTLPRELASIPLQQSARHQIWPIVLRAGFFPLVGSLFEFWERCVRSTEFSHAIHIWSDLNNLEAENSVALTFDSICIDLTGLLTLAEFDLLPRLTTQFDWIFIALGTKLSLLSEQLNPKGPHPLAEKIYNWYLANRNRIRIRDARSNENLNESHDNYFKTRTGVWVQEQKSVDQILGDGIGENLLLSRKLGVPLYSDESLIRYWASSDYQVKAFSSLSFIYRLVSSKQITEEQRISIESRMIKENFRIIPISVHDLQISLKDFINKRKQASQGLPSSEDLNSDPILGILLRQFGDTTLHSRYLNFLAVDWWLSILTDRNIPDECVQACMVQPSHAISMKTSSGILTGVVPEEPEMRVAGLWALFLWRTFRKDDSLVLKVWLCIPVKLTSRFGLNLPLVPVKFTRGRSEATLVV